jgi:ArsR family transcriptional regulator
MTTQALTLLDQPEVVACCTPLSAEMLSEDDAQTLSRQFAALADPVRLRLVSLLSTTDGAVCACDLVAPVGRSQPTVSHHLKVLRQAGIVDSERQGLWAYYYVTPDSLKELSAWLS